MGPAAPTDTPRRDARLRRRQGCPLRLSHIRKLASEKNQPGIPPRPRCSFQRSLGLPHSVPQGWRVPVTVRITGLWGRYPVTAWPGFTGGTDYPGWRRWPNLNRRHFRRVVLLSRRNALPTELQRHRRGGSGETAAPCARGGKMEGGCGAHASIVAQK